MKYDVFICHSSKDKTIADTICGLLEENGVICWIAPRNVRPGSIYAEEIVDGIESSLSVLLVLSEYANESLHVRNEMEQGVSRGKVIFPVLIRNVKPSKALDYYIATSQWTEAWIPPLEKKIIELSGVIKALPGREFIKIRDSYAGSDEKRVPGTLPERNVILIPQAPTPEPVKTMDELLTILSDQLEQHYFEQAELTISEIMVIDSDNVDAINARALIDQSNGLGKIKSFNGPGVLISSFFLKDGHRIIAVFGGIAGNSPSAKSPSIAIWNIDSGRKLFEFFIPRKWNPTCLSLSSDEKVILAGDFFGIYLISLDSWNIIADYQTGRIQCASFLPSGNRAITGGDELLLWDFELRSVICRFKGHIGRIQSLAVTPDGKRAVTGGEDATIRLWDLQKKQEIWSVEGYKVNFQSIAISSDGNKILAGGDKIIRLIDLNDGSEIQKISGHKGYTLSIAFSPDGKKAVSGGTDNIVRLWDLINGHQIRGYKVFGSWTGSVGFSPDGRFAFSDDLSNIYIWALPE